MDHYCFLDLPCKRTKTNGPEGNSQKRAALKGGLPRSCGYRNLSVSQHSLFDVNCIQKLKADRRLKIRTQHSCSKIQERDQDWAKDTVWMKCNCSSWSLLKVWLHFPLALALWWFKQHLHTELTQQLSSFMCELPLNSWVSVICS